MLLDWLPHEGWMLLNWWLMATLAGIAALPLCARLLYRLPDRGFTLARGIGLVVTCYTLWILTSAHLLQNTPWGIVSAWPIVAGVSAILYLSFIQPFQWRDWWRKHRSALIVGEMIFLLVFVGWSVYRAAQNSLFTAEKPMDSAFLSAIMHTTTFPPPDPWLSGYSINYYYFGHLIGAELSLSAQTVNTSSYNLWLAMMVALAALATYGVVYNLIASRQTRLRTAIAFAVLGGILVNFLGNYEFAFVELPYNTGSASPAYLEVWDVPGRETPREVGVDTSLGTWQWQWWFTASRVIKDRVVPNTFLGDASDLIDEFPAFSYLQADDHAYVMAIFLSIAVIGLAFNLLLQARKPNAGETLFYALIVSSLLFVNTWNYPPGLLLMIGAEGLRRLAADQRLSFQSLLELFLFSMSLVLVGLILYAPFLLTFTPGLTGLLPNLYQGTRPQQMLLALGALLPLMTLYVGVEGYRVARQRTASWRLAIFLTLTLALVLVGMTALLTLRELTRTDSTHYSIVNSLAKLLPDADISALLLHFRLEGLPTLLLLFTLLILVGALLLPNARKGQYPQSGDPVAARLTQLLIGLGILLLIVPEFVYLFDSFGTRNDTVFKSYIQVWFFWGIGATYGLYSLLADGERKVSKRDVRLGIGGVCTGLILLGIPYLGAAVWSHALWETSRWQVSMAPPLTLDSSTSLVLPDDYQTLRCLQALVQQQEVVVASGVWSSTDRYSYLFTAPGLASGRVGALTGLPTPLGWGGHELIWRDESILPTLSQRVEDMRRLYTAPNLQDVRPILNDYGIDYIVYSDVERDKYWYGTVGEQKFLDALPVVCASGESRIFKVQ